MANFTRKTYGNTYLYTRNPDEMNQHNKVLTDFILKADRIDKSSEAFQSIMDAVKREQRSSVLYSVLQRNDVVLCMRSPELPRAFKVFEAKDLRTKSGPKVFIDVTGLIKLNGAYFDCKNIGILVTYLFGALTYILYRENPIKLTNNSNITIASTECYVAIVNYIIDYLRIIGYSANKDKILYLTALFYLHNLMGKDLDNYAKNIAAKISGVPASSIRSYELYYEIDKDFRNIDTFITLIADTFKLKGLTTEVFMHQWIYLMGEGTQFCTELFTSFSVLITNAYCGSYVVNQKQIERCCGKSMVNYATALIKLGSEEIENKGFWNESKIDEMDYREQSTIDLAKTLAVRESNPDYIKLTNDDFKSLKTMEEKVDNIITFYRESNQINKISNIATSLISESVKKTVANDNIESGVTESLCRKFRSYINESDINSLIRFIDNNIAKLHGLEESVEEKDPNGVAIRESIVELYHSRHNI